MLAALYTRAQGAYSTYMTTTTTTLARPYAARSRRARTVNLVLAREAQLVRADQARRDALAKAAK